MKAKIIKTGELVDVYHEPQHGKTFSIYKESVLVNGRVWNEDELDFSISAEEKEPAIQWKPITEIPTEHWDRNGAISPKYLVKCGYDVEGNAILGYSNYSFIINEWIDCYNATEYGIHKVTEWTDMKI